MLASGVAAIHAVIFGYLRSGDHVVVADVTYEATWRLYTELLPDRYGIEATFVDASDVEAMRAAMRPTTRLVHVEAIANPTTKVTDVAAVAQVAHDGGALLVVDSTFTPPPLYRPLADGADLVIHSLTKYVNGHGDAMGGAVIGTTALVRPLKADAHGGRRRRDLAVQRLAHHARVGDPAATPAAAPGLGAARRGVPRRRPARRPTWPTRACPRTRSTSSPPGSSGVVGTAR